MDDGIDGSEGSAASEGSHDYWLGKKMLLMKVGSESPNDQANLLHPDLVPQEQKTTFVESIKWNTF